MRLANRIQLTTDGHGAYLEATAHTFADDVDFAHKMTPAIAAGLTSTEMTMADLVQMIDTYQQMAIQAKRERILSLSN